MTAGAPTAIRVAAISWADGHYHNWLLLTGRVFSGNAGVPLESIGSLLEAMGMKVVNINDQIVESDELDALALMAEKGERKTARRSRGVLIEGQMLPKGTFQLNGGSLSSRQNNRSPVL